MLRSLISLSALSHNNFFSVDMGDVGELRLQVMAQEAKKLNSTKETGVNNQTRINQKANHKRWFRVALCTLLLLAGQSVGVLLGRLYFDKGGKSKWLATLVTLIGFPILLPLYMIKSPKMPNPNNVDNIVQPKPPTASKLAFVYVSLGLLVALDCFLYSVGLMYLPVSTYSLICASQLAFNALFSFFFNSLKFTPYIVNSLVLLTISSTILVFQPDAEGSDSKKKVSQSKFITGFICTVAASAGYGLVLSLTQFAFRKVIKKESIKVVMDMIIFPSLVASAAILIGLFASGEWKDLTREMDGFELGKMSYVMTLLWTVISWQIFSVGCVGLILDVSSLFSNSISALGLPIVPVFAVIFYHDKMDGIKVMAMTLAVWGFVSYGYQNYLDDFKTEVENGDPNEASKASSRERDIHG